MARRPVQRMRSPQRVTSANATYTNPYDVLSAVLSDVADNREFTFDPNLAVPDIFGNDLPSVVRLPTYTIHKRPFIKRTYYTNSIRGFQVPYGIKVGGMFPAVMCVRRKIRRNVLFAKHKAGFGKKPSRRYRHRNQYTGVKC